MDVRGDVVGGLGAEVREEVLQRVGEDEGFGEGRRRGLGWGSWRCGAGW